MKRNSTLYFAVALLALSLTPGVIYAQNLGDSKVFSPVAAPGFPEGIAVNGNTFYVSGPAAFGQPLGSAYVRAYVIICSASRLDSQDWERLTGPTRTPYKFQERLARVTWAL
jgi:hypothetical protein